MVIMVAGVIMVITAAGGIMAAITEEDGAVVDGVADSMALACMALGTQFLAMDAGDLRTTIDGAVTFQVTEFARALTYKTNGAQGRNRTGMVLPPRDFKSLASTCFATWALMEAEAGIEPAYAALQAAA